MSAKEESDTLSAYIKQKPFTTCDDGNDNGISIWDIYAKSGVEDPSEIAARLTLWHQKSVDSDSHYRSELLACKAKADKTSPGTGGDLVILSDGAPGQGDIYLRLDRRR